MRGYLRKRSKNSWTYVIDTGRDPETGKRKQVSRSVPGTKKDAERVMNQHIAQMQRGGYIEPSNMSFGDYIRQWFEDHALVNTRPTTIRGYHSIVYRHLIPKLGSIPLGRLTAIHLQKYYAGLLKGGRADGRDGGLSEQTIKHHHEVISTSLEQAVRLELLGRSVAKMVTPPSVTPHQAKDLTPEKANRLLEAARETIWHCAIHLALYTGLRRSTILGLRWRDMEFERRCLHITQALHKIQGKVILREPKSKQSRQPIELDDGTVNMLRHHRETKEADAAHLGYEITDDTLVCSHFERRCLDPSAFSHAVPRIAKKAGLGHITLHELRHTHATILLKAGTHPKVVQDRLGHSTISVTMDRYSHAIPSMQREAVAKFSEQMQSSVSKP